MAAGDGEASAWEVKNRHGAGEEEAAAAYWGRFCSTIAARCLECSSLGMRGDPMGVLRVSSSSHQFYEESDSTHDSPRPSSSAIAAAAAAATAAGTLSLPDLGNNGGCFVMDQPGRRSAAAATAGDDPAASAAREATLAQLEESLEQQRRSRRRSRRLDGRFVVGFMSRLLKRSDCQQVASDPMLFPRIALMFMVALLVTVVAVTAWYVASSQIRKSVGPLVSFIKNEAAFDVQKPLEFTLNYTRTSVNLLSQLLSASNATATSPQLRSLLWTGYFMRPSIEFIGFLSPERSLTGYAKNASDSLYVSATNSVPAAAAGSSSCILPDSSTWYEQKVDQVTGRSEGGQAQTSAPCLLYTANPSVYEIAMNDTSGSVFWDIAVDSSGNLSLLGMQAIPSSNRQGGLAFVVRSFNSMLMQINTFQQPMFLMTADGLLIGVHGSSNLVDVQQNFTVPLAAESSNLLVSRVAKRLLNTSLASGPTSIENLAIDGQHYHVNTVPIIGFGKVLVAVLVIPVKNLELGLDGRIHNLGLILLGIAVAVVISGCCLVVMLTKGVSISMRVEQSYIAQVKATKLAEKRSNHKRLFFANMSHDLRTPLAAIIGLIDLCLSHKEHISVELEANMVQMKTCATTLLGILNSILDMSKAEVGKLELEVSDFDLIKVLEEAVDIFAVVGAKKGIEVVLDLPDDSIELVRWVRGDAGRVKQLLCDLLSNGVKFTSQGYVILRAYPKHPSQSWVASASRRSGRWFQKKLLGCFKFQTNSNTTTNNNSGASSNGTNNNNNSSQLSARLQNTDTLEFEFEVEDTGQGIPQARREAVFRNFVQGSSRVHCTYGGTGLGLAIVRSLVHMMGGQIKVANKEGPGTLFKFNLLFQKPAKDVASSSPGGTTAARCWPLNPSLQQQSFGEESQLLENAAPVGGLEGQNLQVVLGMAGELGRRFVSSWLQKKGAQVSEVVQWQQIIPCLERVLTDRTSFCSDSSLDVESSGNGKFKGRKMLCLAMLDTAMIPEGNSSNSIAAKFRADLDELVRTSQTPGSCKCIHISWIFSGDTSNLVWQTLHSRRDLIVHKPVHGSRLVSLVEDLQAQHFQHLIAENEQHVAARAGGSSSSNGRRSSDYEGRRRSSASQNGLTEVKPRSSQDGEGGASSSSSAVVAAAAAAIDGAGFRSSVELQKKTAADSSGSLAQLRILVVEDTVLLQKVTKAMLEREGAEVQVADNGEEAVKLVAESLKTADSDDPDPSLQQQQQQQQQRSSFDLVLMDCQMPVMDGYTATVKIRELEEQRSRIPIIALTAHAMASDEEKCREVGMDAYLTKPLKLEELTRAIGTVRKKQP